MNDNQGYAYDKFYLGDVLKVTRYLFHKFIKSGHDFFESVKAYMEYSPIRLKMDEGNWSALNKGINQVYNSVDLTNVPENSNEYMDGILSDWMADVYVYMQWRYKLSSADLIKNIPPDELCRVYNPLHEAGLSAACEKLYYKYIVPAVKAESL